MKKRTFVLDTCVLLADPDALFRFDEHHVVLPLVVIEELDRQKTRMDEIGANARRAIRTLESLGASANGGMLTPVALPSHGDVAIEMNRIHSDLMPAVLDPEKPDHRILATCLNFASDGRDTVLVTKDAALRIKAAQMRVETQDYRGDTVHVDELYTGVSEIDVSPADVDRLYADQKLELSGSAADGLITNQFVIAHASRSQSGTARVVDTHDGTATLERVSHSRRAFGQKPLDTRQAFALNLLMDPDVPAVSLMGLAGSGKTFLALAAALEQTLEAGIYRRVSVYRPLISVGRQDVGFLPGDLDEKLAPWMAAVYDNLYNLFDSKGASPRATLDAVEELTAQDMLEMSSVTFLRGRSISSEFVIVDEAQNLELPTLKVILTRIGAGSKVVFCGDLSQVDNPYISPFGGVAALIEKMKGSPLFGHMTLSKSVRSPLAEFAAQNL